MTITTVFEVYDIVCKMYQKIMVSSNIVCGCLGFIIGAGVTYLLLRDKDK